MKFLVINGFGQSEVRESNYSPRVGDAIDIFYKPMPKVTAVAAWPSAKTLESLELGGVAVDAIITVE